MFNSQDDEITIGDVRGLSETILHSRISSFKPKPEVKSETKVLFEKEVNKEILSIAETEERLYKKLEKLNSPVYDFMTLESKRKLNSEINDLKYKYSTFLVSKPA